MKHLLSVPPGAGPHPLLCFLHGHDEAAPAPLEKALTRHGPLRAGNPACIKERFIVLAPQLPFPGDVWHRFVRDLRELVTATLAEHDGDAARAYLTGFSFGANGVFDIARLEPTSWAALWPVDPTRAPKHAVHQPVWLSVGAVARSFRNNFIRGLALEAPGAQAKRIYEDHGDDHVGAARRAYADERIYSWLLRCGG